MKKKLLRSPSLASLSIRLRLFVILTSGAISLEIPDLVGLKDFASVAEGDVNIGYMLSVHSSAPDGSCTVLRPLEVVCFEAFKMAVDDVNRRTDVLANISLGFVAVDDCMDETRAIEMAVYMTSLDAARPSGGGYYSNGSSSCPVGKGEDVGGRLVGVTGLSTSPIAVAVAPYFGVYHIPTLSVYATRDSLNDKSRYGFFSRLVPPDRFQVETLLRLADLMDWTYLALVFSEGAYGENGAAQVYRVLRSSRAGVTCISTAVKIPTDATKRDFDDAALRATLNPRSRVALTFVQESHLAGFFVAVRERQVETGLRMLWLGGDGLKEQQSMAFSDVLEGSIYTDIPSGTVPGIREYLSRERPWLPSTNDVWFSELWRNFFRCRLDADNNSSTTPLNCDLEQSFRELSRSIDWSWPKIARVYDAVHVFALAMDSLIRTECPSEAKINEDVLRRCLRASGSSLLDHIRNVSTDGVTGRIRFAENGDLIGDLVVRQYQRVRGGGGGPYYLPVDVGRWNSSSNDVVLDARRIDWSRFRRDDDADSNSSSGILESVCSKPCGRKEYALPKDSACCWVCAECRLNEIANETKDGCRPCPPFTWPDIDGGSEAYCLPVPPEFLRLTHPLSVTLLFLSGTGCTVSLAVFVVYRLNRRHRVVKATSYHLSLVMLCGSALSSLAAALYVMPPIIGELCVAREIGFHAGINLLYGPLLIKNVRTYRIFRSGEKSVRAPTGVGSKAQLVFAACISLLQMILLVISETANPSSAKLKMPSPYLKYVEAYCSKSLSFFAVPLAYNITLMVFCTALGFFTRKLPENFNESAYIFASVAMTLFSWVVFVPAYLTQADQALLLPVVMGFCLVINSFITLVCQFFRVVYAVYFIAPKTSNNVGPKSDVVVPGGITSVSVYSVGHR